MPRAGQTHDWDGKGMKPGTERMWRNQLECLKFNN